MSEINLLYTHSNAMGYGRMGTQLSAALETQGVEVFDHLQGTTEETVANGKMIRHSAIPDHFLQDTRHSGRANVMCLCSVPGHGTGWWKGQVPTVFTMWEAMRLPESFRDNLHRYDTVIVPSQHNLELFSHYHPNVKYVPLGIDPTVWKYTPRQDPGVYFRFLIGGSGKRKGTDLAVAAFKKLWKRDGSWGDGPIPTLVMKNPRGEQFYGHRIEMVGGKLDDAEEVELYANAHCYLQPSRGEGFGLQPLQAIAQGLPTILTDAHGHKAFSHLGLPIGWTESESDYFIYGKAGTWWEPSLDDLCDQMRDVYDHYDQHAQRAKVNAELAREFTWANTARGLVEAIGRERLGPYEGPEEWFAVDHLKYKVVTLRDWPCDIAGERLFFEKGKEYWQAADVKRILFEAGILDPICLDDDDPDASGLTDEQIERCGKYRAQYSNCPTCQRPLR